MRRWAVHAARYYIGKMCPRGHVATNGSAPRAIPARCPVCQFLDKPCVKPHAPFRGRGSLRYASNGKCVACRQIIDEVRRVAGRVQGGRKIKPEAKAMPSLFKYGVAPADLTKEAQDGSEQPVKAAAAGAPVCRNCMQPDTDDHTCTPRAQ